MHSAYCTIFIIVVGSWNRNAVGFAAQAKI
jgi:hypothetical protein